MRLTPRLGSWTTGSHSRHRPTVHRQTTAKLRLQALEGRALPAFGFGSAFNIGGQNFDHGGDIATDASNDVYVSGYFSSGTVDVDPNHVYADNHDILSSANGYFFAAKYRPDGSCVWARNSPTLWTFAVQGSSVYALYATSQSTATQVSRLDSASGTPLWTVTFPSRFSGSVAVGPSGNVYVTTSSSSPSVAYVTKLDASGNLLWTQATSGGSVNGLYVAVDGSDNAYLTGSYTGTVALGSGHTLTSLAGTLDVLVWKLNASGGSVWAGSLGSGASDYPDGIAVDGAGNIAVAGQWGGSTADKNNDFDPDPARVLKLTSNGGGDIFVAKFANQADGSLTLLWAKSIGGRSWDGAHAMAVDAAGSVYTTGLFSSSVDFDPGSGQFVLKAYTANYDVFVSKLDANGNFAAAASLGSKGPDRAFGIAVDGSGNVYTTGFFSLTADFDPTAGTYNLTTQGGSDMFVSKLTQAALKAAGGATAGAPQAESLTHRQVEPLFGEAVARWQAAGADVTALDRVDVRIADLGGDLLGLASGSTLWLDDNAAGYGWFLDPTPDDDREFTTPDDEGEQGRMDLLSVVAHELGHLLGLDHDDRDGDVMGEALAIGVRRVPTAADVPTADPTAGPNRPTPRRRTPGGEAVAWVGDVGPRRRKSALFTAWLADATPAEV
jgi:hypothetical protein